MVSWSTIDAKHKVSYQYLSRLDIATRVSAYPEFGPLRAMSVGGERVGNAFIEAADKFEMGLNVSGAMGRQILGTRHSKELVQCAKWAREEKLQLIHAARNGTSHVQVTLSLPSLRSVP